jgi:hypothetical protein
MQSSLILIFGESLRTVKALSPFAGDTSKSKKILILQRNNEKTASVFKRRILKKFFQDPWCDPENPKIIRFEGE